MHRLKSRNRALPVVFVSVEYFLILRVDSSKIFWKHYMCSFLYMKGTLSSSCPKFYHMLAWIVYFSLEKRYNNSRVYNENISGFLTAQKIAFPSIECVCNVRDVWLPCVTWRSYLIRNIAGCACTRMPGTFFPPPRFSDPGMHHGTCITHVPWCMPGLLTRGFLWSRAGKTFPAFPAHAQPAFLVRGPWG